MNKREWLKAELSEGKEAVVPLTGQSVVLHCCPRDRSKAWASDIGNVYVESEEANALMWESAFGIGSAFDGMKFGDILKDYEVCFTEVPPLELGRFPSPLGISHEQRKANFRAHINRVLDNLK